MTDDLKTSFQDHTGKTWRIEFTVGKVNKLSQFYECDPNDLIQKKLAQLLVGGTYIDHAVMLWAMMEDQANEYGMSEQAFLESFSPEDYELAATALENAITAFTRPAQRKALTESLKRVRAIQTESTEAAVETLSDPIMKKEILKKMQDGFRHNLSQLELYPGATGQGV